MPADLNIITGEIVDSAMKVHSALGPGLLESAYKACLAFELADRGLAVESEVPLPVTYRGIKLNAAYRIDFIVADSVIVEVKAFEPAYIAFFSVTSVSSVVKEQPLYATGLTLVSEINPQPSHVAKLLVPGLDARGGIDTT